MKIRAPSQTLRNTIERKRMTRLLLLRTTAISMICIAPLLFWQVIQKQKGTSFSPASIGLHGEMIPVTESGDRVDVMTQPGMWLDQEGREIFLSDFRGKAAVMAFIYTHCVDTCSRTHSENEGTGIMDAGRVERARLIYSDQYRS